MLLDVENLEIGFRTARGRRPAVDGVSFRIAAGEILGFAGESGCGKSVTALALLGLAGATAKVAGRATFRGEELIGMPRSRLQRIRGRGIAMIFQDPATSFNPTQTIGRQVVESLRLADAGWTGEAARAVRARACDLLREVSVPDPGRVLDSYPHELSGGLCQRAMIAMMLAGEPALLIADEPTTALDVTVQAQILELLRRLSDRRGMAVMLITHDLGVIAQTCARVAVMYCGRLVEVGPVASVMRAPRHPYTAGLLASRMSTGRRGVRPRSIPGTVPAPDERPDGCRFAPRCPRAIAVCRTGVPMLPGDPHAHACFVPEPGSEALHVAAR
ncbi:ABC transporter ATP-binding protein [Stella sp.]|uniref:ABC transporter ATP-binding protein n=1 Tax=Stella sp. TaxID=2912054 RepID=UPI0035B41BA4